MKKIIIYTSICFFVFASSCSRNKKERMDPLNSIYHELTEISNDISDRYSDTIEKYHEGLKSFEENGKFGFKDSLGNVVIKPQFDEVGCFNEGLVSVTVGAKRQRYLSNSGDSATAWIGGKMGFVDRTGKYVVKPIYDYCNFFSQGVAVVVKDNKWGYIDRVGNEIIKLQYDRALEFWDANGFAAVSKDGKWGLIDIKGRVVVPIIHQNASSTQNGVATVFPFDKKSSVIMSIMMGLL